MVDKISVNVVIKNVPYNFDDTDHIEEFIVARLVDAELWWYGVYDKYEKAKEVAIEIGNGVILKI